MRRLIASVIVLLAGSATAVLLVAGGAAADTFAVRIVSEDGNTITLGWDPQPGYGYLFSTQGQLVSRTYDASRDTVKFSKGGEPYEVAVISKGATGTYPAATPPPTTTTTSPPPTTTPPPTGACDTTTPNVPGGPDGSGGCFPGLANTGPNAPESTMAAYTGSCNLSGGTIDSKVIRCNLQLSGGATVKNSYVHGQINGNGFSVSDSIVDGIQSNGYACGDCGIRGSNFTITRTEIVHTNRGAWCYDHCTIEDSYTHANNLPPNSGFHAGGFRVQEFTTVRHSSIACDYTGPFSGDTGCSADITGYPDFTPIHDNTLDRNLFMANNVGIGFCIYGGDTATKPYSNDPQNATNIKVTNNVWQRGPNGKCGAYGPVTDFNPSRSGNVWSNNKFDNGATVNPA